MPCGVSLRVMSRGAEIAWRGNLGLACWLVGLSVFFVDVGGEFVELDAKSSETRSICLQFLRDVEQMGWVAWFAAFCFFAEAMRRGLAECVSANLHEALGT